VDLYEAYRGEGAEVPEVALRIDELSPISGYTYRELVQELDDDAVGLSEAAAGFVADCVDEPETIVTERQLRWICDLWEEHLG